MSGYPVSGGQAPGINGGGKLAQKEAEEAHAQETLDIGAIARARGVPGAPAVVAAAALPPSVVRTRGLRTQLTGSRRPSPPRAVYEIAQILDVGLDKRTLSILIALCEHGVNPEALAAAVKELQREAQAIKGREAAGLG